MQSAFFGSDAKIHTLTNSIGYITAVATTPPADAAMDSAAARLTDILLLSPQLHSTLPLHGSSPPLQLLEIPLEQVPVQPE